MAEVVYIDVVAFSGGPTRVGVITNEDVSSVYRWDVEEDQATGVRRVVAGQTPVLLRSTQVITTNLWSDFESEQGTMVTYSTSSTAPTAGEINLAVIPPDVGPWLVPIVNPEVSASFDFEQGGFPDWERPVIESVTEVPGRRQPHVVQFGRGSRRGDMTVVTGTWGEAVRLRGALDVGGVYFLSLPPSHWPMLVASRYVMLGSITETPLRGIDDNCTQGPAWRFKIPLSPTTRPDPLATFSEYDGWAWSAADPGWADGPADWQETMEA